MLLFTLPKQTELSDGGEQKTACCKVALGIDCESWENIYNIVDCPTTIREQFSAIGWNEGKKFEQTFEAKHILATLFIFFLLFFRR